MANPNQPFFLEDWLRTSVEGEDRKKDFGPVSVSARAIIDVWGELRESLLHHEFDARHVHALKVLVDRQNSLYIAEPQAKILLMILSLDKLPQESYTLIVRLLCAWVRKSPQASQIADYAVHVVSRILFQQFPYDNAAFLLCDGILFLGALSFRTALSDESKRVFFECISKFLNKNCTYYDDLAVNTLAGIGYALSSSSMEIYFRKILDILLSLWGDSASSYQGLVLLHLVEWVLSNALSFQYPEKIKAVKEALGNSSSTTSFGLVMFASAVVRAINRSGSSEYVELKYVGEEYIAAVATDLLARCGDYDYMGKETETSVLFQYLALALARSGPIAYRPQFLVSLTFSLLAEVFPLKRIYDKVLSSPSGEWVARVREDIYHVNSCIFKEAGTITGVLCNQYASADENTRMMVENLIWDFCQKVYRWHRQVKWLCGGHYNALINEIEKIAESAFFMVVVFASGVRNHRLDARINLEIQSGIAVQILTSFACMEYFRRIRLSAYMDTLRAIIPKVQENESACAAVVESMPLYTDLISLQASSESTILNYMWCYDDVQTARIVFYLRVIPTFTENLKPFLVKNAVAPIMFLYMGHPSLKVSRYSHSLFVALISSVKDFSQEERLLLNEMLSFHYVKKSVENYPEITPFEGLASGVTAIVRHLPAGNASIFYCINEVAEKARILCQTLRDDDGGSCNKWEVESDPSKRMCDLLLRLLSFTDIQVFPSLMKQLARLIVELPRPYQNILLNQLSQQIAESDDVIRKPTLVSWTQSLSYLCSQRSDRKQARETVSSDEISTVSLARPKSRL